MLYACKAWKMLSVPSVSQILALLNRKTENENKRFLLNVAHSGSF